MLAIDHFPVPVIAAIRGYCMGGGMDLALACDYRIASPDAVFGHRGASLGLITGWGGTQRLPRLIGKARALQMFLLAEMVNAEEAKASGLWMKSQKIQFAACNQIGSVLKGPAACWLFIDQRKSLQSVSSAVSCYQSVSLSGLLPLPVTI